MVYSPAFIFSSGYSLGFCRVPGFALGCCASFKRFWPLALVQQALPAIILQALRRLRGAVLFRSLRPSSSWGFPVLASGSNCAVKPTRILRAAYFRALAKS